MNNAFRSTGSVVAMALSVAAWHTAAWAQTPATAEKLAPTVAAPSAAPALAQMQTPTQAQSQTPTQTQTQCAPLLNYTLPRLQDEAPQSLCQYSGKVLLIVNTASFCGFTPQYEGLEALHAKYSKQGLVVLGFPSNDFSQEPGSAKDIADFCSNTFGVKFPMFTKTSVVGKQVHPLFAQLAKSTGKAPSWNFGKYLVDRSGKAVAFYGSTVSPDSKPLVAEIEKALAAK